MTSSGTAWPSSVGAWLSCALALVVAVAPLGAQRASSPRAGATPVDASPHRSAFVTHRGVRLHYLEWGGTGPTVVPLPGYGLTAHAFDGIGAMLAGEFRVIAATPRGYGESDAPPDSAAYTVATMVADVRALLDSLGVDRATRDVERPLAVEHCWWSTNRSALPPDSVVARFVRASAAVGFAGARSGSSGDTAWVQTAPTALPDVAPGITYAMHAVGFRVGDSTHYRYSLSGFGTGPAPRTADEASAMLRDVIPTCTAVARAAAIPGVQPAQPTGEETMSVWRWRR